MMQSQEMMMMSMFVLKFSLLFQLNNTVQLITIA